jgi:hypothetical protein
MDPVNERSLPLFTRELVNHIPIGMELQRTKLQMSCKTLERIALAGEGARVAIGQTRAGRHLRVVYVPELGGTFVITAYELRGKPLMAYRRRRRQRGKR